MSTTHDIPELDKHGLRNFGLTLAGVLVALFGLLLPLLFERDLARWPWIVGSVLGAWAVIFPASLRLPYRGWMRLGLLLSRITTPLILGVTFYLVLTPTALLRRAFGAKDALARRTEPQAESYRVASRQPDPDHLSRPF